MTSQEKINKITKYFTQANIREFVIILVSGLITLCISYIFQKNIVGNQQKYDLNKFNYEIKIKTIEHFSKLANTRYLEAERFNSVPCSQKITRTGAWIEYYNSVTTWNQYLDFLTPQINNSFSNALAEKIISNVENKDTLHDKFRNLHIILEDRYENNKCNYNKELRKVLDNIANSKKEIVIEMQNETKLTLDLLKK